MKLEYARSLLFLPASNGRAIEKARGLSSDMVILDLEDAIPDADKDRARRSAVAAIDEGFGTKLIAVRLNMAGTRWHQEDIAAFAGTAADYLVLPKVESAAQAERVYRECGRPVIAMIESVKGLMEAQSIAAAAGTAALFVGTNDLRIDLKIPAQAGREGLVTALQMIVMAARLSDKAVFDGVYNQLDDADGFMAECREGYAFGFDGKTLIHPNQIAAANTVFGPSLPDVENAYRLIAAASGGAERFEGRMIESMHVTGARALIARAEACGMGR
ncbi:HpcH/HpaI aldolase/citrate lyase family protein [Rhizorhapis sp. SPR117]|uniref:HpcH/HpaI aldolase/citrate lyase family protein n=1 Tax=Rhizorhapis sp. SPR117 TaxID=2912611 RepID=UPI001F25F24E|nr:CoA ester lyase [Rhizorhapis sp. SPR117]